MPPESLIADVRLVEVDFQSGPAYWIGVFLAVLGIGGGLLGFWPGFIVGVLGIIVASIGADGDDGLAAGSVLIPAAGAGTAAANLAPGPTDAPEVGVAGASLSFTYSNTQTTNVTCTPSPTSGTLPPASAVEQAMGQVRRAVAAPDYLPPTGPEDAVGIARAAAAHENPVAAASLAAAVSATAAGRYVGGEEAVAAYNDGAALLAEGAVPEALDAFEASMVAALGPLEQAMPAEVPVSPEPGLVAYPQRVVVAHGPGAGAGVFGVALGGGEVTVTGPEGGPGVEVRAQANGSFAAEFSTAGVAPGTYEMVITAGPYERRLPVTVAAPGGGEVTSLTRLAGPTRVETAVALSEAAFEPGVPVAYLASSERFADALAAGPASRRSGPVLVVPPGPLPDAVAEELQRLAPARVVIAGGSAALPRSLEAEVAAAVPESEVLRLAGADRAETAALLALDAYPGGTGHVVLATGTGFADALAAGAWATRTAGVVLLPTGAGLSPATLGAIDALAPDRISIVGGPAAVSDDVRTALAERYPFTELSRTSGADRYATAGAVSNRFPSATAAVLATGTGFADALAAVPFAATRHAPLLLVPPNGPTPPELAPTLSELGVRDVVVAGGPAAVSDAALAGIAPSAAG